MEKIPNHKPEEQTDERSEKFDQAQNGELSEWEKELEKKKKEHRQEEELDKLIKKLEEEKENKPYQKKKFRR